MLKLPHLLTLLIASSVARGQNTTATSSRVSSASSTVSTTRGTSSATSSRSSSATTATSLLAVPTASGSTYSNEVAASLQEYLPGYLYNLTSESLSTRTGICNQTTQFCASSKCSSSSANVTVNFCNVNTMGYNCECNNGATSRLQPLLVPVNSYDCRLRTQACLQACQNPNGSPPVQSVANCQTACNYIIGATCGTPEQVLPEYKVNSVGDVPKYYSTDTTKGGAAGSTSSAARRFALVSNAALLLAMACSCGVIMGGGLWQ